MTLGVRDLEHFIEEIRLEAGPPRDKWIAGNLLFARLGFSETSIGVSLGEGDSGERIVSKLWSQTVFELENLAEGLRFVAQDGLPPYYDVPSRDSLIGPTVRLRPALQFQLGHPGLGKTGLGTLLYCSKAYHRLANRGFVDIEAMNLSGSLHGRFEIDDVLAFAEKIYDKAKRLAPQFVVGEIDE